MKKQYTEAEMEIIWLKKEDVIITSGATDTSEGELDKPNL